MKEGIAGSLVVLAALPALALLVNSTQSWQCEAQWENSGLKTDYGFVKGCQLQLPTGKWVPAKTYRTVD